MKKVSIVTVAILDGITALRFDFKRGDGGLESNNGGEDFKRNASEEVQDEVQKAEIEMSFQEDAPAIIPGEAFLDVGMGLSDRIRQTLQPEPLNADQREEQRQSQINAVRDRVSDDLNTHVEQVIGHDEPGESLPSGAGEGLTIKSRFNQNRTAVTASGSVSERAETAAIDAVQNIREMVYTNISSHLHEAISNTGTTHVQVDSQFQTFANDAKRHINSVATWVNTQLSTSQEFVEIDDGAAAGKITYDSWYNGLLQKRQEAASGILGSADALQVSNVDKDYGIDKIYTAQALLVNFINKPADAPPLVNGYMWIQAEACAGVVYGVTSKSAVIAALSNSASPPSVGGDWAINYDPDNGSSSAIPTTWDDFEDNFGKLQLVGPDPNGAPGTELIWTLCQYKLEGQADFSATTSYHEWSSEQPETKFIAVDAVQGITLMTVEAAHRSCQARVNRNEWINASSGYFHDAIGALNSVAAATTAERNYNHMYQVRTGSALADLCDEPMSVPTTNADITETQRPIQDALSGIIESINTLGNERFVTAPDSTVGAFRNFAPRTDEGNEVKNDVLARVTNPFREIMYNHVRAISTNVRNNISTDMPLALVVKIGDNAKTILENESVEWYRQLRYLISLTDLDIPGDLVGTARNQVSASRITSFLEGVEDLEEVRNAKLQAELALVGAGDDSGDLRAQIQTLLTERIVDGMAAYATVDGTLLTAPTGGLAEKQGTLTEQETERYRRVDARGNGRASLEAVMEGLEEFQALRQPFLLDTTTKKEMKKEVHSLIGIDLNDPENNAHRANMVGLLEQYHAARMDEMEGHTYKTQAAVLTQRVKDALQTPTDPTTADNWELTDYFQIHGSQVTYNG